MEIYRLNLWSGPRNVSTALMYSFAQRSDTRVVDEPLYGHYLRVSGADHPGRDDVLAAMDTDGDRVVREVILGPSDRQVLFFKQMAHHLVDIDDTFLDTTHNVLLIRDPYEMLPSLIRQIPEPTLEATGLAMQTRLFEDLRRRGQAPAILDARELLLDPPGVLHQLCEHLGIPFEHSMLHWPAGARPEDGVWADHWYHAVRKSNGFKPYMPKPQPFPERLEPLLAECQEHYDQLFAHVLRADA